MAKLTAWGVFELTSGKNIVIPLKKILSIEDNGDHRILATDDATYNITSTIKEIVTVLENAR